MLLGDINRESYGGFPRLAVLVGVVLFGMAGCGSEVRHGSPIGETVTTGTARTGVASPKQLQEVVDVKGPLDDAPARTATLSSEIELADPDDNATAVYLEMVLKHADRVWTQWFLQNGLTEPDVDYRIIRPGETANSVCRDESGRTTYSSTYPNAFYCPNDRNSLGGHGLVVAPVESFRKMWTGDIFEHRVSSLKRVGDFAAAVIVAHEFGHHIQDELSEQTGAKEPLHPEVELIADCFAGVWAYGVFLDRALSDGDIDEAVNALEVIGDDIGSHGTGEQRKNAFLIGFTGTRQQPGGGIAGRCIENYWRT